MARDYKIRVRVDNAEAKRELKELDKGLGGLGITARQVGVAAGAAALGLASMVARQAVQNAIQQEQALRQLESAIMSTGGAAGRTSQQLQDMASALQQRSIFGDDELMKAQSQLLTFTSIAGEAFDRTMQSVVDLSVRMDQDLRSSVVMLGKALNDPVANLGALSRAGIQFSDAQKEVIKDLAEGGRLAEAQSVILEELERQFGGAGAAARDTLGGAITALKNNWGDFVELLAQDEAGAALRDFVEKANTLLLSLIENWGAVRAAALNTAADFNEAAASVGRGILAVDKFLTRGKGPQIPRRQQRIDDLMALAQAQREAAEEALSFGLASDEAASGVGRLAVNTPPASKAVQDLAAKLAQGTRQEEFLIAAFKRGEAEFRRAERVVAAYNAVIVDGKAQISLFDEALKLEGLRTQRENLERLDKNFKELAKNIKAAEDAYRDFIDESSFVGSDAAAARPVAQQDQRGFADYTEAEWAATLAAMSFITEEQLEILTNQARILETLTDWQGAAYIVADAFEDVDSALADVFGAAGDFLGALTKINDEGGKLGATLAGLETLRAVGNAVTGPNNYGAEGAAAGALIGALVGAYYGGASGAQAGAALGGAAGGALGSFVKKGVDEFLGHIEEAEGYAVSQMDSARNSISQIGKQFADAISRGINDAIDALGGELLGLPQLDIKIRDGVYSVFSNGITARFSSMQEAVDFAILQALREGDIYGLSEEVRKALENSTAESFASMAKDLDFARWVEGLPEIGELASASATALDAAVDQYRASLRKATQLGIDTAKIDQWFAGSLQAIRNNVLGIVETNEERIRRESEAFNREVQLMEAEQLARSADLAVQKITLEAEVSILRAKMVLDQQELARKQDMLEVDIAISTAEWELLQSKLSALAAIDAALLAATGILASLPDLISDADINDAINRARGGGGRQRAEAREDIQAEVLLYGLSDVQLALAEAGLFASDFAERIKGMGFSAEEAARLLALAQEEQERLADEVRNGVRQTYYDAIAQAQGLSEIWGVLDQFRDLRQNILDAGLSAEETAERLRGIDWAEDVELAKIEVGIVDRLFGYLQGEEAWAAQSVEFAKMKVELEFGIMRAQLQLLGVFEQYVEIFDAALAAALKAAENVDLTPPAAIRDSFREPARDAERIAESFRRAKADVSDFLNEMLRGELGGTSPLGGLSAAQGQFDEVLRQALTGNIGAIESFDDYGSTLLKLARDAYGSSPEFQAIYDYVLAAGRDVLGVKTGREGNLVFDERFYQQNEQAMRQRDDQLALMQRIAAALEKQQQSGPIAGQGVNRR